MDNRPITTAVSFHETLLRQADVELLSGPYWLNDTIISFYFEYLEVQKYYNNLSMLFVPPDVTQCIKMSDELELETFLKPLDAKRRQFIFFALNDHEETENSGGSHWSLLVFSRPEKMIYHFDSSRGANHEQALDLSRKILFYLGFPSYDAFTEYSSLQQTNGYDCGIYVLCNAEHIADYVLKYKKVENCPLVDTPTVKLMRPEILSLINFLRNRQ